MMNALLLTGLVLMMVLSTAPLPYSSEGATSVEAGGMWQDHMDLGSTAHVTYIVRSSGPVDVTVVKEGDGGDKEISSINGTMLYRYSGTLGEGRYLLVVTNHGQGDVGIEYQVHQDFIVVANMTAKNVMGLSLALAMVIVAVVLYVRPRRT